MAVLSKWMWAGLLLAAGSCYATTKVIDTGIAGVVGTIDDRLESFDLSFAGGAVSSTFQKPFTVSIGENWPLIFTLSFHDVSSDGGLWDSVTLTGNVKHEKAPHTGDGVGSPYSFAFSIHPEMGSLSEAASRNHGPHKDLYTFGSSFHQTGVEINSWSITLSGRHVSAVPEPSVIAQLCLGLGVMGGSLALSRGRRVSRPVAAA